MINYVKRAAFARNVADKLIANFITVGVASQK